MRGIGAMIDNGRYCVDILTQLQAARAALARVEREILDDHVAACVADAAASGDVEAQRAKMAELTELPAALAALIAARAGRGEHAIGERRHGCAEGGVAPPATSSSSRKHNLFGRETTGLG